MPTMRPVVYLVHSKQSIMMTIFMPLSFFQLASDLRKGGWLKSPVWLAQFRLTVSKAVEVPTQHPAGPSAPTAPLCIPKDKAIIGL